MFDHLDDPDPFVPPARWHDGVRARARRRQRRRRLAAGSGALAVATVAGLAVAGIAVRDRTTPQRVDVAGLTEVEPAPGQPLTVLFVGVDAPLHGVEEGRTDTIVVARVDPARGQVRVLPVPRDLWLPLGSEGPDRVNQALERGGPGLLVDVLRTELGIEVDRYVQVEPVGAARLVDALGGVRVSVPRPVRSDRVPLDLEAGCQTLGGDEVVQLGRARDVEVQDAAGAWQRDPRGDVGRQDRTAVLAAALLRAVGEVDGADLPALVEAGLDEVRVDDRTTPQEVLALGRAVDEVVPLALPLVDDAEGEMQVLRLSPGAADVVAALLTGEFPSGGNPPTAADGGTDEATGLALC